MLYNKNHVYLEYFTIAISIYKILITPQNRHLTTSQLVFSYGHVSTLVDSWICVLSFFFLSLLVSLSRRIEIHLVLLRDNLLAVSSSSHSRPIHVCLCHIMQRRMFAPELGAVGGYVDGPISPLMKLVPVLGGGYLGW